MEVHCEHTKEQLVMHSVLFSKATSMLELKRHILFFEIDVFSKVCLFIPLCITSDTIFMASENYYAVSPRPKTQSTIGNTSALTLALRCKNQRYDIKISVAVSDI